ncbi:MAG TPA: hypothetical protein VF761_12335 [Gemmatimonadaceae bacterium]
MIARRGDSLFVAALAAFALAGCESQKPEDAWWTKVKPTNYASDSTAVVRLATHALGDSLPMRVESISKAEHGWLVRLLPMRGGLPGGGSVWVELSDSSATVVKRY